MHISVDIYIAHMHAINMFYGTACVVMHELVQETMILHDSSRESVEYDVLGKGGKRPILSTVLVCAAPCLLIKIPLCRSIPIAST